MEVTVCCKIFAYSIFIYFKLCTCVGRYDGTNRELPALEAPGAAGIGYVGLGICCALIAAIMMLDLVGIHKHLVFLRKNVHFGWNQLLGLYHKKQPVEETPENSPINTLRS